MLRNSKLLKFAYANRMAIFMILLLCAEIFFVPQFAHADVQGSLNNIRNKLTGVILPVLSVISVVWSAFALLSGHERAKTYIWYSIIGSALAFGAQSIVDFISQAVK